MKISNTKLSKTIQCGQFFGKLYGPSKKSWFAIYKKWTHTIS